MSVRGTQLAPAKDFRAAAIATGIRGLTDVVAEHNFAEPIAQFSQKPLKRSGVS